MLPVSYTPNPAQGSGGSEKIQKVFLIPSGFLSGPARLTASGVHWMPLGRLVNFVLMQTPYWMRGEVFTSDSIAPLHPPPPPLFLLFSSSLPFPTPSSSSSSSPSFLFDTRSYSEVLTSLELILEAMLATNAPVPFHSTPLSFFGSLSLCWFLFE